MAAKKKQTFSLNTLEATLEKYFGKQAPQLPKSIKKIIVDFGPWLLIISILTSLPGLITTFGFSFSAYPYHRMWGRSSWGITYVVISILTCGLSIAALPGLFKKSIKGWRLVFYTSLISLISPLITLNLIGFVVSAVLSWYFIFQIKSYYK